MTPVKLVTNKGRNSWKILSPKLDLCISDYRYCSQVSLDLQDLLQDTSPWSVSMKFRVYISYGHEIFTSWAGMSACSGLLKLSALGMDGIRPPNHPFRLVKRKLGKSWKSNLSDRPLALPKCLTRTNRCMHVSVKHFTLTSKRWMN